MARPISYTPPPPKTGLDAHEELDRLLQTCHEQGVLRLANDLLASNGQWAPIIIGGLNSEGSANATQNLCSLMMLLGRIPPADFHKVLEAMRLSFASLAAHDGPRADEPRGHANDGDAPGLTGAYRLLRDDALWHALLPLLQAVKVFAQRLEQPSNKPVTDWSGKDSQA